MAKSTIQFTSNATQTALMGSEFVSNIRATLVSFGLMLPQIRHYLFKFIMQVSLYHIYICISIFSNVLSIHIAIRYHRP
jgi:hypothetical protein